MKTGGWSIEVGGRSGGTRTGAGNTMTMGADGKWFRVLAPAGTATIGD